MNLNDLDKLLDELLSKYQSTYLSILKKLGINIEKDLTDKQKEQVIEEIEKQIKKLEDATHYWVFAILPAYYLLSMDRIDKDVKKLNKILPTVNVMDKYIKSFKFIDGVFFDVKTVSQKKAVRHIKAIEVACNSTFNDLAANTRKMNEEAKKIIRSNGKHIITNEVKSGESQRKTKKELREALMRDGITTFVDARGTHWNIANYADMAVRTKSRDIHNQGTMNRLSEYGKEYPKAKENFDCIQISSHGSTCWCGYYELCVFSVSGEHPDYPPVTSLPNRPYSNFHPRCRHVFLPYMPGLRGKGKVAPAKYLNKTLREMQKLHYHSSKKK